MKRTLPLLIVSFCGFFMLIAFFIPVRFVQNASQMFQNWYTGIAAFFIIMGIINLVRLNIQRIRKKQGDSLFGYVLLVFLVFTLLAGMIQGSEGSVFLFIFDNFQVPLGATMFSLLAFFVASASFRAFRAKTPEATLLLIAAVIVMIGRIPVGYLISHHFPGLVEWLMNVPNTAAKRGILFGVDLGLISMALRILLGVERSYLGGNE